MKTKFYTGDGDAGTSSVGKKKWKKSDVFFEALGTADEVNALLGLCRVEAEHAVRGKKKTAIPLSDILYQLQEYMFIVQSELAAGQFKSPNNHVISAEHIKYCERVIRDIDAAVPKLEQFVVPGGSELSVRLDVTRTVARRLERRIIALPKRAASDDLRAFCNRLSSVLFACARYANARRRIRERNPSY